MATKANASADPNLYPKFQQLPIQPDAPPHSAWGVFDNARGARDVLGTLNFITHEVVVAAKDEIQTGESVVLKYASVRQLIYR